MQIDLQNEHYDFNGDLYYPKNVTNYPVPLKGHKEFQWFELAELPIIVKSIYNCNFLIILIILLLHFIILVFVVLDLMF